MANIISGLKAGQPNADPSGTVIQGTMIPDGTGVNRLAIDDDGPQYKDMLDILREVLVEMRAIRIGIQTLIATGDNTSDDDLYERSCDIRDQGEANKSLTNEEVSL